MNSQRLLTKILDEYVAAGILSITTNDDSSIVLKWKEKAPPKKSIARGAIPAFADDPRIADYLKDTSQQLQEMWIARHQNVSAIKKKILDLISWELSRPEKAKKNKGAFINNCLLRDLPVLKAESENQKAYLFE